jgi:light-regulated signal transduction histidine kinase (bacteriophytochrome)
VAESNGMKCPPTSRPNGRTPFHLKRMTMHEEKPKPPGTPAKPDAAARAERDRAFIERYQLFFAPSTAEQNEKKARSEEMSEHEHTAEARRQELERQVAERTAQLDAANKELEAFNYSVSHDLRAPLRVIGAYAQKLLEGDGCQLDATGRGHVEKVLEASGRMGELIEDLLKLSQAGSSDLKRAPVNLSDLAQCVVKGLAKPDDGVRVTIAPNLVARGDVRLLRIVFENLLGNAWKFVGRQLTAEVEFGVIEGRGVRAFYVRDNGAGFDMAYAQRLFGAFQRFHGAEDFPGTGIGLATVQRIIHRHGGRVWAESRVGKGAAFYFTLPE